MAEHSVQVTFKLISEFGSETEIVALDQLAEQLEIAIDEAGVGEFDGDDYGSHVCRFYMYGPDADALYSAIENLLQDNQFSRGITVYKRYGEANDDNAQEVEIQI